MRKRGTRLHLHRPTESPVIHAHDVERGPRDRAERAEVARVMSIENTQQQSGERVAEHLRPRERVVLDESQACAERARADDEVGAPLHERREQRSDVRWVAGAVAVGEEHDVARRRNRLESAQTRRAVPPRRLVHDERPRACSDGGRVVARSVVADDDRHLVAERADGGGELAHDGADAAGLVERGNDHGHVQRHGQAAYSIETRTDSG